MLSNKVKFLFGGLLLLCSGQLLAASSPLPMLQKAANGLTQALAKNKSRLSSPTVIKAIVDQHLMPVIDKTRMAQLVLGRSGWANATAAQRKQFIAAFRNMVIATYASAFASYNGDTIKFSPIRGGVAGRSTVVVNSVIVRRSGQTIAISYNCRRVGNVWKVYDFSVENISMVNSYRSQFASILQSKGINALITQMKQRR